MKETQDSNIQYSQFGKLCARATAHQMIRCCVSSSAPTGGADVWINTPHTS